MGAQIARPASPAGFVLGYVRFRPYGKDSMTAYSSAMCSVFRRARVGCVGVLRWVSRDPGSLLNRLVDPFASPLGCAHRFGQLERVQ
jgi:hypothetical protein